MKSLAIASTLLGGLLSTVSAWACLSASEAQSIVDQSIVVIKHPDVDAARAVGLALYDPNVVVNSDSIDALNGYPLGQPIYTNVTAYLDDTLSIQGPSAVNLIDLVVGCYQLVWYWEFDGVGGPTGQRVRGMTLTTIGESRQVVSEQVEFNSLTWAADIGYTITPPPEEKKKMKREFKA